MPLPFGVTLGEYFQQQSTSSKSISTLVLERRDDVTDGWIEPVVLLPRGEIDHRAAGKFVREIC
jgi:hypothetical protein